MKNTILLCFILILLLPVTFSYSLSPMTERIYFEPGLQKTITFTVKNNDAVPKVFRLEPSPRSEAFSGIADQMVDVRGLLVTLEPGEEHEFSFDITLPDSLPYGVHDFVINIYADDPYEQKKGMLIVKTILGFKIRIYSLYPGKHVEVSSLIAEGVNIGEYASFETSVRNIGTEDILKARAKFDIYLDGSLVGSVYSDYRSILSKDVEELKASLLITEGYKIGQYVAKAVVEYDGKTQDAEYTQIFNVGELSISILNITSRRFENNKINKFDIDVESKWNKAADVYAELVLTDFSGNDIDSFKTQTVSVEGWRKAVVPAYMDLKDIANDNYILKVILHYEGKTSRRTFAIEVSDKGEAEIVEDMPGMPKQTIIIILLSVVVVLLIVVVIMFFLHGLHRKTGYERPVEKKEVEDNKKYNKPAEEDEGY